VAIRADALAASTAAVGALGGWWIAQPGASGALPEIAVARHVAALSPAGPRVDIASESRHVVRPWFQGRLDFAPTVRDLSSQGFDLLGARKESIGDREAVAVVYRLHAHVIDVFSWRRQAASPLRERAETIRGFNVITWSERDLEFAAVSDTDATELQRFVVAYRSP
jgi:anti-sigma factor RsiW